MVGAHEADVAIDGAFLPGAVGVAGVDGGAKGGFDLARVEKLGAVVGGQGLERVAVGAEARRKRESVADTASWVSAGRKYM